jgi:hypothetical protein
MAPAAQPVTPQNSPPPPPPQQQQQQQPLRDLGPEASLVLAYHAAQNRSLFAAQCFAEAALAAYTSGVGCDDLEASARARWQRGPFVGAAARHAWGSAGTERGGAAPRARWGRVCGLGASLHGGAFTGLAPRRRPQPGCRYAAAPVRSARRAP